MISVAVTYSPKMHFKEECSFNPLIVAEPVDAAPGLEVEYFLVYHGLLPR